MKHSLVLSMYDVSTCTPHERLQLNQNPDHEIIK